MIRRTPEVRRARQARDPYGLTGVSTYGAPIASAIGLAVIAWLTIGLLTGDLVVPGATGSNTGNQGPLRTPTPSGVVVVVPPEETLPGSLLYAKGGNLWIQSGETARQLTVDGDNSMPSFSPDGKYVYYIHTKQRAQLFPYLGNPRWYDMDIPVLSRIRTDGSGKSEELANGRYRDGRYYFFYWMREPVLSPNGRTIALLSDAPDALRNDVVLQFYNLKTKRLTNPHLSETSPLGHQDPAWRPDGQVLLYVRNGKDGSRGTPVIYSYTVDTKKAAPFSGPGYSSPAWSRSGRYVAATTTDSFGTDIVILDGRRGTELLRVTNDGKSWAPVWSPTGDAIAFLHLQDSIVDLRVVHLEGSAGKWTVGKAEDLTQNAGLDSESHPGWFVPADQLQSQPTTAPLATDSGSSSAAP
jgi:Tol biopolymer transport system component